MNIALGTPGNLEKTNLSASGFKPFLDMIIKGLSQHNTTIFAPHGGDKIINFHQSDSTDFSDQYTNTMACANEFAKQMQKDKPDAIIACTNMGRFLKTKHIYLTTTLPYKLSHHMLSPEYPDIPHYNKLVSHLKFLGTQEKQNYEKAELILTASPKIKSSIIQEHEIDPEKIIVLPYPIMLQSHHTNAEKRDEKIQQPEHQQKDSRLKMIIMPQEVRIMKGIKDAIETMKLVKKTLPNAVLIICGKVNEYEKPLVLSMLKEARQQANIILAGFLPRDQYYKYLAVADCAFLPVLSEGQCGTMSECIASQLPVVTNEFNQYPEEIIKEVGHFAKHRNTEDYAQGILKLLTDQSYNNKKREAAKEVAKIYSFEKFEHALNKTINSVWQM